MRTLIALAIAGTTLAAAPALARDVDRVPLYSDSNSHYLDYKTDLSEARRELRKDLRKADTAGDREDAWSEYRREVADARHDFRKEMLERGVPASALPGRTGTVTVTSVDD